MSGLVFVGTAIREQAITMRRVTRVPSRAWSSPPVLCSRDARGHSSKSVLIETAASDASCGVGFEIGKQYLVYAWGVEEPYGASVCSRTAPLSAAKNELALLREYRDRAVKPRLFGTVLGTIMPRSLLKNPSV